MTEDNPNLFRAAENDDVEELGRGLAAGRSLSEQDPAMAGMTPVHLASARGSENFLTAASRHPTFNPWLRDYNDRVPSDHASAFCNHGCMQILFDTMYGPVPPAEEHQIDYTDNAPALD